MDKKVELIKELVKMLRDVRERYAKCLHDDDYARIGRIIHKADEALGDDGIRVYTLEAYAALGKGGTGVGSEQPKS